MYNRQDVGEAWRKRRGGKRGRRSRRRHGRWIWTWERSQERVSEKCRYESTWRGIARRRVAWRIAAGKYGSFRLCREERAPRPESDSGRVTPRETSYISCITNVRIYHLFISPAYVYFPSFFSLLSFPLFYLSRSKMYAARVIPLLHSSGICGHSVCVSFEYDAENAPGDFAKDSASEMIHCLRSILLFLWIAVWQSFSLICKLVVLSDVSIDSDFFGYSNRI